MIPKDLTYPFYGKSARFEIRPLTERDIDSWRPFFEDSDSLKYLSIPDSDDRSLTWINKQLVRYEQNSGGLHAVVNPLDQNVLAQVGLVEQETSDGPICEIAYHVLPKYRGQGIAGEVALFFRDYFFENGWGDEVSSIIAPKNLSSKRVAAKNGMSLVRVTEFKDIKVEVYSITKSEWLQLKNQNDDE